MIFKRGKEIQEEGIAYKNEKCPFCKGDLIPKSQRIYYMETPVENAFTKSHSHYNYWECFKCGKRFEVDIKK